MRWQKNPYIAKTTILLSGMMAALAVEAQVLLDPVVPAVVVPAIARPAGTYSTPVSALQFDPRVEIQGRLFNEAQSDVTIRGGTFESTGFVVGAATLLDPQTGHYFAEIPIPVGMLLTPQIWTGAANSLGSFNSTAGSIHYGWAPVREGGEIGFGFAEYGGNSQEWLGGLHLAEDSYGGQWYADSNFSRSEGRVNLPNSDHSFTRVSGRIQRQGDNTQTDVFAGYQEKFFGLQNLYAAPFNSFESENLKTRLFMLNHRYQLDEDEWLEVSGYYRRHTDDYDFDRFNPGVGNPFQHETIVGGGAINGRLPFEFWALRYGGNIYADQIESTALTFGPFQSRTYWNAKMAGEYSWEQGESGLWTALAGFTWDDSNRDSGTLMPISRITYQGFENQLVDKWRAYADFSGASQVPGYTAIGSSPTGGLFRGNPDLGREKSYAFEMGLGADKGMFASDIAGFIRRDENLTDWTFLRAGGLARTANPIDLWVYGLEWIGRASWERGEISTGYAFLRKSDDYGTQEVDASFYALNYPEHRFTLTLRYDLTNWMGIECDNEWRIQRENELRNSGDRAWLTDLALYFQTDRLPGAQLWVGVSNLWEEDFEEVPGVPQTGRIFFTNFAYRF